MQLITPKPEHLDNYLATHDRVVVVAGLSHMLGVMQLVDIDAAFLK